jgi:hypothetical protein
VGTVAVAVSPRVRRITRDKVYTPKQPVFEIDMVWVNAGVNDVYVYALAI